MEEMRMDGHSESSSVFPPFKKCPKCGTVWATHESFLEDRDLWIIGYQVHFEELTAGFFLFNHSCLTTLGVEAGKFQDLYDGPIFAERLTGTAECGQFCFRRYDLRPCPAKCEFAYVREIIQIIKNWPMESDPTKGKETMSHPEESDDHPVNHELLP